jgi:cephalosporin hydroxylase
MEGAGVSVAVAQTPFELEQMVNLCRTLNPKRILEVGVWHGGTLREWLRLADTVVAVDNQMLDPTTWQQWAAEEGADLMLIHGDSHHPDVIAAVAALGPYDFALLDADHSYGGVRADWLNYGPHADVVAFHDILPRPDAQVDRLWAEIKQGRRTVEIVGTEPVEHMDNPVAGVGVVFS